MEYTDRHEHQPQGVLGIDWPSLPERLQLVEEIWDSIAAEADALEVPDAHKEELDRRLAVLPPKSDGRVQLGRGKNGSSVKL